MKKPFLGVIAAGLSLGFAFGKRRRAQRKVLDVFLHGMREGQFRRVTLAIERRPGGAQTCRFSGYVGTALFTFTVTLGPAGTPRTYHATLGDRAVTGYRLLPTDANGVFAAIDDHLRAYVRRHGIRADISGPD